MGDVTVQECPVYVDFCRTNVALGIEQASYVCRFAKNSLRYLQTKSRRIYKQSNLIVLCPNCAYSAH
jgi:hypothetical protein